MEIKKRQYVKVWRVRKVKLKNKWVQLEVQEKKRKNFKILKLLWLKLLVI